MSSEKITIYRAMSKKEYLNTMDKPYFRHRYKWFYSDLSLCLKLMEKPFRHKSLPDYSHLISFEISLSDYYKYFNKINKKELMLDLRNCNQVKFLSINLLNKEK